MKDQPLAEHVGTQGAQSAPSLLERLEGAQLDPLRSQLLQGELPGLSAAFDGEAMRRHLQEALFDGAQANVTIEHCTPGQAIYDGDQCVLRYKLQAVNGVSGETISPLVIGRLFRDLDACKAYARGKLAPLAALMKDRQELESFAQPVALIEPLNMVAYVFPIDGELPALVGATDPQRMTGIFKQISPLMLGEGETVEDCKVGLGHYGRQHRCVLRYHVESKVPATGISNRQVVYGKVAADGRGALAGPVIDALRERVLDADSPYHFNIPRSFGFFPDLQLALLEGIPGVPQVAQLLKARMQGEPPLPGSPALEETIDACARIGVVLHTSGISLGEPRALEAELATLREGFATVERISPDVGAQFFAWLDKAEGSAKRSRAMQLRFGHGDFTYTQLI